MIRIYKGRHACDVLEELRKMDKTKNYSSMLSCVEELQIMCQRMEDALSMQKDFNRFEESRREANKLIKKYNKEMKKKKPDMEKVQKILDEMKEI